MLNRGKFTPTNSLAPVDRPSYIIVTIRRQYGRMGGDKVEQNSVLNIKIGNQK